MFKYFYVILFLLCTLVSNGQKSSLVKNVNFRAKDLKHNLNKSGDTLVLESNQTIYGVEIYSSFYEKKSIINRYKTKIPIGDLPIGRYVIDATLVDRHIVMTLFRHEHVREGLMTEDMEKTSISEIETTNIALETIATNKLTKKENDVITAQETKAKTINSGLVETEFKDNTITTQSKGFKKNYHRSPSALLNTRLKKSSNQPTKNFWVEIVKNHGNSSSKTKKIIQGDLVKTLIAQNQAEIRTASGKNNTITIWEVYDTQKFMKEQLLNRNYVTTAKSDSFNSIPYYTTKKSSASR